MSEYVQNGKLESQNGHTSTDLEDSVLSLLSNDSILEATTGKSLISKGYKKAAKQFINKHFDQSLHTIEKFVVKSVELYDNGEIEESLYINVWSLYFNLIDILINKEVRQLKKQEHDDLENSLVAPNGIFTVIYNSNKIAPPKLVVLLLLIKLNNDKVDLASLRQQIDIYLVQGSAVFRDDPAFVELSEIYHVHLLTKMGEFEEAEYLIKTNPLLRNKEELLEKVNEEKKISLEEAKRIKHEAEKKKQLAQLKKEQAVQQRIKEKQRNPLGKTQKKGQSIDEETKDLVHLNVIDQIKKRIMQLTSNSYSNRIIIILSLISFIFYLRNSNLIHFNENFKRRVTQLWSKILSTVKMAFKVTYV